MDRKQRPNWCLLYLMVPLVLALLVLESQIPYPLVFHRIGELTIVLSGFGLMFVWVRSNEGAMINEEFEKEPWIIEPDPAKSATDPALPFLENGCDDSGDGERRAQVSPTKGRYN